MSEEELEKVVLDSATEVDSYLIAMALATRFLYLADKQAISLLKRMDSEAPECPRDEPPPLANQIMNRLLFAVRDNIVNAWTHAVEGRPSKAVSELRFVTDTLTDLGNLMPVLQDQLTQARDYFAQLPDQGRHNG